LHAGDGEAEANHAGAIVGAKHVSAHPSHHSQKTHRDQVAILVAPDDFLHFENGAEFLQMEQLADFPRRYRSLASCHRASISSMVASWGLRPCSPRRASIWLHR